ncbi:hypothetical protein POM88_020854 [Heracleum sosnowskyi]|uniref:Protein FAR1-RELATED SEQUENCE n=1 Tax=Heracleum sosnowskyi TaxID=360622 RepID=A0AAD8MSB9_9APIA|nr:hypothetical protein POM88_020854 [Heracleum sosnowskyi]
MVTITENHSRGNDCSPENVEYLVEAENTIKEPFHFDALYYTSPAGVEYFTLNCDEKYKPYVNRVFPSVDAGYEFYKEYGRLCGFDVRKSTSKHASDGTLILKYIECSRAGIHDNNNYETSKVIVEKRTKRRRTTSRRCDCNAMIKLKYAGLRGYVVSTFVNDHNHSLASATGKQFLRCSRQLNFCHQNFIFYFGRATVGPVKTFNIVKEMVGSYENVCATSTDFKNFNRDLRFRVSKNDADMIIEKFRLKRETSNNTFFYEYKQDKDGHLTGLFWADATGIHNYSIFGDTLSFVPTYRPNKYCMVFITFTGVDNHWSNVTFAAALIENKSHTSIKWALDAFDKCMDHIPPCVITDQCCGIKKAISLV